VVYVEGHAIVAAQGSWRERLSLAEIPLTRGGTIGFQVENAMAAVGAAWGVGLDWDTVRRAWPASSTTPHTAPGRFNVMDYRGATLIADYGHNPDAMRALVRAVEAMPGQRRSVVISGAGDRRDEDLREQTVILGAAFDEVILYQDAAQRGRADGEVMALLRQGLQGARAPPASTRSGASSPPSTWRWNGCDPATCAWCWSTRCTRRWTTWRSASARPEPPYFQAGSLSSRFRSKRCTSCSSSMKRSLTWSSTARPFSAVAAWRRRRRPRGSGPASASRACRWA
jgi:hypothetical protein